MAELADALDSGSSESNFIWVQVPLPAPNKTDYFDRIVCLFLFLENAVLMRFRTIFSTGIVKFVFKIYVKILDCRFL